jgi:hypothetical protein
MHSPRTGVLTELTDRECRALLGTVEFGHLGTSFRALPVVIPVKIQMSHGNLGVSSLLDDAIPLPSGSIVALQAGSFGGLGSEEWSVGVCGHLQVNDDHDALNATLADDDAPEFWLSTEMVEGWVHR